MTEREKDLHLKIVCITARLMSNTKFDSSQTRAEYRSSLDDQIESLDDYVIDLLAEHLKVAELYDIVDLNHDDGPETDGLTFVGSYKGYGIHSEDTGFMISKGMDFFQTSFASVEICKWFIDDDIEIQALKNTDHRGPQH
jgi:hypothetical protein